MRRPRPRFWPAIPARPFWPWEHTYWAGEAYINMAEERSMLDVAYTDLRNAAIETLAHAERVFDHDESVRVLGEIVHNGYDTQVQA